MMSRTRILIVVTASLGLFGCVEQEAVRPGQSIDTNAAFNNGDTLDQRIESARKLLAQSEKTGEASYRNRAIHILRAVIKERPDAGTVQAILYAALADKAVKDADVGLIDEISATYGQAHQQLPSVMEKTLPHPSYIAARTYWGARD